MRFSESIISEADNLRLRFRTVIFEKNIKKIKNSSNCFANYYSTVKDIGDLGLIFWIVQNRPTNKAVYTKISNIYIFLRENKGVSFLLF